MCTLSPKKPDCRRTRAKDPVFGLFLGNCPSTPRVRVLIQGTEHFLLSRPLSFTPPSSPVHTHARPVHTLGLARPLRAACARLPAGGRRAEFVRVEEDETAARAAPLLGSGSTVFPLPFSRASERINPWKAGW